MKKSILLSVALFSFAACNNTKTTTENSNPTLVGNNKDDHGCKGSAGQQWSDLKQSCIQVFKVGHALKPTVVQPGEAVFNSYVVYNDDQSKAELYIPQVNGSVILNRSENGVYQNESYTFKSNENALYKGDVKIYEGEK